jgi:2'-5' RNA ligase
VRLFVAVYPPTTALDDLERFSARLLVAKARAQGVNTRVTARALWHVTLAFLGEVPDDRVPEAARAVDRATEQVRESTPSLRIAGGGRFGRERFTVLWAGVQGDVAGFTRIAAAVRRELSASRLRFDNKRFSPHLTLARPGDKLPPEAIDADIAALAGYRGQTWSCPRMTLVASHLGPAPRHEPIHQAR